MYIDTGSPVPNIPSKSCDLADENKKTFDGMEMTRNNGIEEYVTLYLHFVYSQTCIKRSPLKERKVAL